MTDFQPKSQEPTTSHKEVAVQKDTVASPSGFHHTSPTLTPENVAHLQRTIGNQATINMLQKNAKKPRSQENVVARKPVVQRAVDQEGVPTTLDPIKDAEIIKGLKDQYVKFQKNLVAFWDSYDLEHPANKEQLFQKVWGEYLDGLKSGATSQGSLATVQEVNDEDGRTNNIEAPGYKSILGVKSVPHPAAKPRTAEEQALADEMGMMRMQLADQAMSSLQNLVESFSTEFDKAIAKVKDNAEKENSNIPWYKFWANKKKPNYIFWSGSKSDKFVSQNHSPKDSIQLEMTMGKMAWLDGLGVDYKTKAPNAINAYTGQHFHIWSALSERYALKAAAEAQKGNQWNFIGYMSDIAVDEQSVYNTIERPTIVKNLGVDINMTWKLVDEDPQTKKLEVVMVSKNRNAIIEELKRRTGKK